MRRYGDWPRAGATYRRRPGAYALILRGRSCLLAMTEGEGETFLLPGGGVDPGETPLRALHREVMEETGWTIGAARRMSVYQRYTWMPEYSRHAHKICHLYIARAGRSLADPIEPDHHPVWVDFGAACELLSLEAERDFVLGLTI